MTNKSKCPLQGRMGQCKEGECFHNQQEIDSWEKEFDEEMTLAAFGFGEANIKRLKSFIFNLLTHEREKAYDKGFGDGQKDEIEKLEKNIGFLRQWLNEEKITDPKKLVTNEDLKYWLVLKLADSQEKEWLIWSIEHDAWWAKDGKGYVQDVQIAGRYSYKEAMSIIHQANIGIGSLPKERPYEAMVHVSVLLKR